MSGTDGGRLPNRGGGSETARARRTARAATERRAAVPFRRFDQRLRPDSSRRRVGGEAATIKKRACAFAAGGRNSVHYENSIDGSGIIGSGERGFAGRLQQGRNAGPGACTFD